MRVVLLLLMLAATSVDCQVEFLSSQQGRDVNFTCTLRNTSATNLHLVIGASVSRLINNKEEVLAAVTSVGGNPISHSGVVTSSISLYGTEESYVNIEWSKVNRSIEGDYICSFNGLDINNAPVLLKQTLTFALQDPGPGLKVSPAKLEIGLTKSISIKCYVSELAALNVSQVTSITLSHFHDNLEQLLATILISDGTEVKPGSDINSVDGFLGGDEYQENYLEAVWVNPTRNRTGRYECTFNALDTTDAPVNFVVTHELIPVDPSVDYLLGQLQELQKEFEVVSKEKDELATERDRLAINIRVLQESLKGHKICDNVDLPVGQYPILLFPDDGLGLLTVVCDVVGPGDVWTVFQKRYSGAVDFARGFAAYDDGFGSLAEEHWLGLKNMKRIMTSGKYQIRVDITDHKGVNHTRIYPTFDLGPRDAYTLTVSGYNDGGHGLSFSSGAAFSTHDHGPQPHCAVQDYGGWWYDNCAFTNLNGKWGHPGESGVSWFELPDGRTQPLKSTEMKFRKAVSP